MVSSSLGLNHNYRDLCPVHMVDGKALPNLSTVQISYRVCHVRPSIILQNDERVLQKVLPLLCNAGLRFFFKKKTGILCMSSLFLLYGMY